MIKRTLYSVYQQQEISLFVLENKDLKVSILDYGATITSIIYKPLKRETVLGLRTFEDYRAQPFYLGALVGRVANRIAEGRFQLNGTTYELPLNGPHHLHGGPSGFDQRKFTAQILDDELILTLVSADCDQGYPGIVDLQIVYALEGASLVMTTSAISDQDTLFDPTQHTYFNLNPDHADPVVDHVLKLNSELIYAIDPDGCTGKRTLKTAGTPFDFAEPKTIREALDFTNPQISLVKGLDHYFMKKEFKDPLFCTLSVRDLTLSVKTTHGGAHVYTGNFLEPLKNGAGYPFLIPYGGICFETQHVPNSINFDLSEAPVLKAQTLISSETVYAYTQGENHGK